MQSSYWVLGSFREMLNCQIMGKIELWQKSNKPDLGAWNCALENSGIEAIEETMGGQNN